MKKKLFLFSVLVLSVFTITAQEKEAEKGFAVKDIYISGTLNYRNFSESNTSSESTVLSVSPSLGYFVSEHIALELGLTVGTNENFGNFGNSEASTFGVEVGGKYFFTPNNRFSFTAGANIFYRRTSNESSGVEQPSINSYGFEIAPGLNYFISKKFALTTSIGMLSYTNSKSEQDGANAFNTFDINLDFSNINLGLLYKF